MILLLAAARAAASGPSIDFSTTVGGSYDDQELGAAVDPQGNVLILGLATSPDLPVVNAFQPAPGGGWDGFVAKLDREGGALVYCTYLGGMADDIPGAIAADANGDAVVVGTTSSPDFPVRNPWQPSLSGSQDAFLTRLDASGQLVYGSFLGGSGNDNATDVVLSAGLTIVAAGTGSPDFPVVRPLQPAFGGAWDGVVATIDSNGALTFATFLGGAGLEDLLGVAVDPEGRIAVAAVTESDDYPLMRPLQAARAGRYDAAVTVLAPAGASLDFSTYLGGSLDDYAWDIAIDAGGIVHVAGQTDSNDFPVVAAPQPWRHGLDDAFLSRIDTATPALLLSTFLGGIDRDEAMSVGVDVTGASYVLGITGSADFPIVAPIQAAFRGVSDAFLARVDSSGSLTLSTYLGGSGVDAGGDVVVADQLSIYLSGSTVSSDFPLQGPLGKPPNDRYRDAFATHITFPCAGPLQVSPAALPDAAPGGAYAATIAASGGTPPYRLTVVDGALPSGIAMSPAGVVAGATTIVGTYSFDVAATDAAGSCGSRAYTLRVTGAGGGTDLVAGRGPAYASPNAVSVLREDGSVAVPSFDAYAAGHFGVNVAAGPLRNDGRDEIVTGPGPGPVFGPNVRGFEFDGARIPAIGFFAYGTPRYGVDVSAADVDGDGYAEIVTGAGPSPAFGPHVRGFDFDAIRVAPIAGISFYAYATVGYGVLPAGGDIYGTAREEMLTAPGPSLSFAPLVHAYAYYGGATQAIANVNFWAFSVLRGGGHVAAGDVDGDGFADIVAAPGSASDAALVPRARVFRYEGTGGVRKLPRFDVVRALAPRYGGMIAAGDLNGAGPDEVVVGYGQDPSVDASVRAYTFDVRAHAMTTIDAFPAAAFGTTVAIGRQGF